MKHSKTVRDVRQPVEDKQSEPFAKSRSRSRFKNESRYNFIQLIILFTIINPYRLLGTLGAYIPTMKQTKVLKYLNAHSPNLILSEKL